MRSVVEAFRQSLTKAGGTFYQTSSLAEAQQTASELIDSSSVARWADPELVAVEGLAATAADADISLIVADLAVAQTGQIAFEHRDGRQRATGILPPRQIVLLKAENVVATVAEALTFYYGSEREPPSNLVFIAGPSRTSDIEQRVIRGAHGPKTLTVIVFGEKTDLIQGSE